VKRGRAIYIALAAMVIIPLLVGAAAADWGKKEIQLHCYRGSRDDNRHLGTVDVFDLARPSSHCNIMYNDCNGNCTACYDDEAGREVCADNSNEPYIYQ
jgi:hypothetical protein